MTPRSRPNATIIVCAAALAGMALFIYATKLAEGAGFILPEDALKMMGAALFSDIAS